jgi:hypothetical protein
VDYLLRLLVLLAVPFVVGTGSLDTGTSLGIFSLVLHLNSISD